MNAFDSSYVAGFLDGDGSIHLQFVRQLEKVRSPEVFLQLARQVDAFATLNYSNSKRIYAADVEQHLRSMGVLCPCNDFLASNSEGMASQQPDRLQLQGRHDTPAPRNRVKV